MFFPAGTERSPTTHKVSMVLNHARHKPDALMGERFKPVVVVITAIKNDDGAGANRSSRATRISWVLPSLRTAKLGRYPS
ncbi:MAG: hypothetical protein DMG65_03205 [Candidatus Angelobacter sp. Gp1-AA117]|nr:MAG: hypothetical protein DMG65_03205 [Candidatus Angelobacter sp. Gp1-AA117]